MDDFSGAIDQLKTMLQSEDGQNKLQSMIGMLAGKGKGGDSEAEEENRASSSGSDFGENAEMFMKMQKMMSLMKGQKNQHTDFLNTLKPYLGPERREKVDHAVKLMGFAKVAALFKEMET